LKATTLISSLLLGGLISTSASAHFQMIHADNYLREKSGKVTLQMPFTHPSSGAPMMAMSAKPKSFFLLHKGKATDLSDTLESIQWQSGNSDNEAVAAWQAPVRFKRLGDYVFSLIPEPYYEESEDKYIQQFTKVVYNVGGLPTDWDTPVGLPVEIIPDQAPYSVYAGGTFSGVVMADGKPAANAEIEGEFLNREVDPDGKQFLSEPLVDYPSEHLRIVTIRSDKNGRFMFGIPHAGYWGFAALNLGEFPRRHDDGKPLSRDAVLWIQAHELRRRK